MTELEKIAYAKRFLDMLADGVNPVDGSAVPEGDVAAQTRVTGCFRYVSELLGEAILAGGIGRKTGEAKEPFSVLPEQLMQYRFPPEPRTVSQFVQAVNDTVDLTRVRSLRVRDVTEWLTEQGLLEDVETPDGRKLRRPTEKGKELGMIAAERTGRNGRYIAVTYDRSAQTYLLDHMAQIAAHAADSRREREEHASGDADGE